MKWALQEQMDGEGRIDELTNGRLKEASVYIIVDR